MATDSKITLSKAGSSSQTVAPVRTTSPAKLRTANLPYSQDLARDIESISRVLNNVYSAVAQLGGLNLSNSTPAAPSGASNVKWSVDASGNISASVVASGGNTILNGAGAPTAGTGNNGDFYIDTTAHVIYGPKASGAWPATGTSMSGTNTWG